MSEKNCQGLTRASLYYLAEFLLDKGYEVHGITRRASISNTARIDHIMDKIVLHDGDLSDSSSLIRIISIVQPEEIIISLLSHTFRLIILVYLVQASCNIRTSVPVLFGR